MTLFGLTADLLTAPIKTINNVPIFHITQSV